MKQRLRFDPKNKSVGIKTDRKPEARHVVISDSKVTTRVARKTKKGCADLLKCDDEWATEHNGRGFLSEEQRSDLINYAGKAYKTRPKAPDDSFKRPRGESVEEYVERIRELLTGDEK